ncbi:MAG: hypothetical protein OXG04_09440 [Acidobacteria bacterium]|nr:hypothetical protein [Acidobacteriota bacterium]
MRIAFDIDGVLADFAGAYRFIAHRLRSRGPATGILALSEAGLSAGPVSSRLERRIWREIQSTENFWATLDPLEPDVIAGIHERAGRHRWETFFVTQRPATRGDTVQRQTQRWLVGQGFPLPAVIAHRSSRGKLAAALDLDFLVDDTVEHCVDVLEVSSARPILVCRKENPVIETNAKRLGIATCRSVTEALDIVVQGPARRKKRASLLGGRAVPAP